MSEATPLPAGSQRWSKLRSRLLSAAVLIAAVLLSLWSGPPLSDLAVALAFAVALWEWLGLTPWPGRPGTVLWGTLGTVLLGATLGSFALLIRLPQGRLGILLALAVPLVGDSAAYFAGTAWGRHRLAPRISPRKSWEGAAAGVAASVLTAALIAPALRLSPLAILPLGAALAVVGQASDLGESALKRRVGIKDSGRLIPGHGGLLDRIDSVVPAALLVLLWARITGVLG